MAGEMSIKVTSFSGKAVFGPTMVERSLNVGQLRTLVCTETGAIPECTRLILDDRELEDAEKLESCKLDGDLEVALVVEDGIKLFVGLGIESGSVENWHGPVGFRASATLQDLFHRARAEVIAEAELYQDGWPAKWLNMDGMFTYLKFYRGEERIGCHFMLGSDQDGTPLSEYSLQDGDYVRVEVQRD
eukprot:TRINITY_DN52813_c0_g1_i1.p1 TRINITY_DN52813_c0_g1~~TRINITY_DN52813_c0_g1_i1.p1  ORF type:complete len:188 (-),score=31.54 TRINITY_DN52813_c0_g1_i1:212-775(-)